MTPLGTLIFSAIGALFVAGVVAAIWWGLRGAGALDEALKREGWTLERQESGSTLRRIARRTRAGVEASIEVVSSGVKTRSVWTHVRLAANTGEDDVLVERKAPAFMTADGRLAASVGFVPPPRWEGALPGFATEHVAYASSESAAQRWLSEANQNEILAFNLTAPQRVAIRVYQGMVEARWAREPLDAAQIEAVVALLGMLRRQQISQL